MNVNNQSVKYINPPQIYNEYLDCEWKIIAPADYFIKLDVQEIHLPVCNKSCDNFIEIRDGLGPNAEVVAKLYQNNATTSYVTSGRNAYLRLFTNGIQSKPFTITVSGQLCKH